MCGFVVLLEREEEMKFVKLTKKEANIQGDYVYVNVDQIIKNRPTYILCPNMINLNITGDEFIKFLNQELAKQEFNKFLKENLKEE